MAGWLYFFPAPYIAIGSTKVTRCLARVFAREQLNLKVALCTSPITQPPNKPPRGPRQAPSPLAFTCFFNLHVPIRLLTYRPIPIQLRDRQDETGTARAPMLAGRSSHPLSSTLEP